MKGILACDIDGTLTDSPFHMPEKVAKALHRAYDAGWSIIFITGRPYVWGVRPLQVLDFPYYLAVINGANLIEMPVGKLIEEKLIPSTRLGPLDKKCAELHTDYVCYTGFSGNDVVYYRPQRFVAGQQTYLERRAQGLGETWIAVEGFSELPVTSFASVKCFGDATLCAELAKTMEFEVGLHVPVIRDPFNNAHYVAQATDKHCTKGETLRHFVQLKGNGGPIIAAGDDFNDISMLKEADIRIVMATAPREVISLATVVAPAASQGGLADALIELIHSGETYERERS
jgi:hydroxymethylpyrimidine pyrophosphatase-like HAD family hydrolase